MAAAKKKRTWVKKTAAKRRVAKPRTKAAEGDRPASARTVLAYCSRHLVFWRETLAAGLHVHATSVDRAAIGASNATVRSPLLTRPS